MRAIRIHEHGGPEVLTVEDVPAPEPGPGQVRVRVRVAGVNFIDIYHRSGLYPMDRPFIPGQEGSGEVDAVGDGVDSFAGGERVAWASITGSYAEYAIVPASGLVRLPDSVSFELAAAVMLQGMTAHYLAFSTFPLGPDHRCLIHAAAGGVGLLLVQMAKRQKATVYGTVGSNEKADRIRQAGADAAILYREEAVDDAVLRLTDGKKLHVVYDSVGQSTFESSLRSLRPRGMLVSFGQSSGPIPPFNLRALAGGSLYVTRPKLGDYIARPEELEWRSGDLFRWIAAGELDVRIDSTFALERVADAQRRIESRESSGKILLTI